MMKILVVIGGGRPKGNTEQLADAFIKGAAEAGHEVEKVSLRKTEVKGCMGCNSCRYGKPCVQKMVLMIREWYWLEDVEIQTGNRK